MELMQVGNHGVLGVTN